MNTNKNDKCGACWGSGERPCGACGGKEHKGATGACGVCGGSGMLPCGACGGTGK